MKNAANRERNLCKGLLAGLIGGIAGAAVILMAEEIFPPRDQKEPASPLGVLASGGQLPQPASEPAPASALQWKAVHWTYGAVAGGIYGIAAEVEPSLAAWRGAAFGLTLNRITHEALLPQLGLEPSKEEQSARARVSSWISHAAYGITADSIRRIARRLL